MSSNPPFDLGSLGDVESPELVKEALRTFRRRTLRSSIWVVAVVAMLAVPLVGQLLNKNPQERIAQAEGFDAGTVYTDRGVTLVLVRVADLGDRTGIHLIATSAGTGQDLFSPPRVENTYYPDSEQIGNDRVFQGWYSVQVPSDGKLHVELHVPELDGRRTFLIDLKSAGVPERLWQKGDVR